ncbi:hypothetical protein [Mycobacterium sp. PSTR-4-N]|uniref:hypothetical protein n=1 Tax=Mycobacterium sp. PSTR-4-N TaxID=2917745 RepID=UPI001F14A62B|nr:hypothetical protein [Mycobacterium sp. PSTR-4-N]MCG7592440.1 hypothetical protein [Mycobacterium sp. PSTR-4-N]
MTALLTDAIKALAYGSGYLLAAALRRLFPLQAAAPARVTLTGNPDVDELLDDPRGWLAKHPEFLRDAGITE